MSDRPPKSKKTGKPLHHTDSLFALGKSDIIRKVGGSTSGASSGASSSSRSSTALPVSSSKSSGSSSSSTKHSSLDKKREHPGSSSHSSSSSSVTKKLKTQHVGPSSATIPVVPKPSGSLKLLGSSSALPSVPSLYGTAVSAPVPVIKSVKQIVSKREEIPDDFSVDDFLSLIDKESGAPSNTIQSLIVQAIRNVKSNHSKTDPRLCMGLMRASILNPLWFQSNAVVDYITSLLSTKKVGSDVRSRFFLIGSPVPPFLVCLLTNAYAQVPLWPIQFFQAWIEDACNDRIWVDRPQCKSFTDNILHSFNTVQPNPSLLQTADGSTASSGTSSPLNVSGDQDTANFDEAFELSDEEDIPVLNRVGSSTTLIENIVMDCVKDIVSKKTGELPKSLFKALGSCCGLSAVQSYVLSKLDIWIHNQKTGKYASDLLLYLCCNIDADTDGDHVTQILKMRYKQKQLTSFAALAVKEMVLQSETNMRAVLNFVIGSELGTAKHQMNIPVLSVCMANVPDAPQLMAEIFLDQMARREECHGLLRPVLRDTFRAAKYEFELRSFVAGLTQLRMEHEIVWKDEAFKERCFVIITDLIMLCMFLNVTPPVRDYAMLKGDSKDATSVIVFQNTVAQIQEAAISWMYHVVPQMFKPSKKEFGTALSKILLRDPINDVVVRDNWPPEGERSIFARLCLDIPLRESSLLYTLMMGISKEHPLNRPEILDIVEVWIMQAAQREGNLKLAKPEVFKGMFRLCEYKHPENIVLPSGYDPPLLAISRLYWKVWILLCIISAHNPATLGKIMWESYPTLRAIMEMCMTGHFSFPTPSTADSAEELSLKEIQVVALEKTSIVEFEQHLASASSNQQITEKTSLLLPQLMSLDPQGIPRSPPHAVLSQLMSVNEQLHLGQLFCRSRNPDFLLDLMQNNSQPMPWLYELVAEGPIDILPVQCLCELMLGQVTKISKLVDLEASGDKISKKLKTTEDAKNMQILRHLQKRVLDAESTDGSSKEIVEYFLRKLYSAKRMNRQQALQGLQLLLSPSASSREENWLVDILPTAPVFSHIRSISITCLRQAFAVETEPFWLSKYLEYLSVWINVDHEDLLAGLTIDVANFVVERNGVFQIMLRHFPKTYDPLFEIFTRYIKRVQTPTKEAIQLSEDKDQILVQWTDDKREASLNIIVVHAVVMTMAEYSRNGQSEAVKSQDSQKPKTPKGKTAEEAKFQELLNIWFPANSLSLRAYELSTMEDVILFPDWLKSKMISTSDRRLVSAALEGADSDQLILYVQCFGIPVTAMKCLLNCLDTVFKNQPDKKIDPAKLKYLKALVEAQPLRGATGGEEFLKAINRQLANSDCSMETETAPAGRRVRRVMPTALSKKSKPVAKPNLALEPNCKREDKIVAQVIEPLRLEGSDNDKAIRKLSQELLNTLSLGNRRRSSAPTEDSTVQVSTVILPRRHSMYVEKPEAITVNVSLEGPILDKFVELEPSIVKTAVDMQTQLIFERSISPLRCRPFLLNALAHQSSWKSVGFCIEFFMKTCDTKYDPTNVLDLIAATVKNPALWHGGDKFIPKHQPEMPMIHLNRQQLLVLAEYIIEEVSCTVIKNAKFSISNLLGSSPRPTSGKTAKPKQKLKERVRLWLVCCKHEKALVNSIIQELLATKSTNPHAKKFLAQLYLEFPEAMMGRTWQECDEIVMNDEDLSSNLDAISFNLVNSTALNEPGKDWLRKAQHHLEPALRKLALTHPVLLLRQLPMMCTLLEGRVHLDFNVFQAQNQHIPFKVFLGLWEFMLPHILKHFKVVKNAFMLYFKLFENFAHIKDFSLEVRRISVLLHNFWQKNSAETEEFLLPYHKLLVDLGGLKNYIDVSPLHNLIETIIPPQDRRSYIAPMSGFRDPTGTHGRNDLEADTVMMFLDRMQHVSMVDDMYPVLQDLDMASNRNPAILSSFSEKLKTLLTCNNEACRTLSLSLVLKHMTYMPKCQNVYFDTIMTLLRSENPQIREYAIEKIPEFVMISHEHAEDILMRLFDLGVTANVNVQPAISRTLAIFRSYTGT